MALQGLRGAPLPRGEVRWWAAQGGAGGPAHGGGAWGAWIGLQERERERGTSVAVE